MKKILLATLAIIAATVANSATHEWRLAWSDDFNGTALDTTVWSLCPRGTSDWNNTMSNDTSLYALRNGSLVLRGVVNPDTVADPSPYLTAGVWTKGKKGFAPGRMEVRARLHPAKGAWPAIWMLPFDSRYMWPIGGEVDILEQLNFAPYAHQTVHSYYTVDLRRTQDPPATHASRIDLNSWNVYGVEIHPDKVSFYINGVNTFNYPRVRGGAEGQFPYYSPMFLIIDMQLGGSWVGEINPADLPVEMEIDWVKYYEIINKGD